MKEQDLTLEEIRRAGLAVLEQRLGSLGPLAETVAQLGQADLVALRKRLGVAGMIRFLQLFDSGQGDYTAERQHWLADLDLETICREIEQMRVVKEHAPARPGN